MNTNIYSCLTNTIVKPVGKNDKRKYNKKLKEIGKLKQKNEVTMEESEKIKKEIEYKKIVGTFVEPVNRSFIMNQLPDDVLFIILSFIPCNMRLQFLKLKYHDYFKEKLESLQYTQLIQCFKLKRIEKFIRQLSLQANVAKDIYSVNKKTCWPYYTGISNVSVCICDYEFNFIMDVCKNYTKIYTGSGGKNCKSAADIKKCETIVFQLYLKMAVLVKKIC